MATEEVQGAGVVTGGTGGSYPTGAVEPFGANSGDIPTGWLECDGSAVSRTTFSDLFNEIGTTYGVGDGSTTFNLPDLRGRAPIGDGQGSGLTNRTLGDEDGEEECTLSESELPAHTHPDGGSIPASDELNTGGLSNIQNTGSTINTGNTGGDSAHNNMHPFSVATFMIKT